MGDFPLPHLIARGYISQLEPVWLGDFPATFEYPVKKIHDRMGPPSFVCWFINPTNTITTGLSIVISTINIHKP